MTTTTTHDPPRSGSASAVCVLWRRWVLANAVGAHAQRHPRAGAGHEDVAHGDVTVVVLRDHPATAGAPTAPAMRRDWP